MATLPIAKIKKLNVKKVTIEEIERNWKIMIPKIYYHTDVYVRCNSKGIINWDNTSIYNIDELLLRGNVVIIL